MFEPASRYFNLPVASLKLRQPDGTTREVRYVRRRLVPPPERVTTVAEHTVAQGDRIDNIAARYLGDPLQFWRICDANNVLSPQELTEEVGNVIDIGLVEA